MENPYQALKSASRLPTPPGVAIRILELVESDETSIEDITQVISGDPALTSKILKFISSPLVGLGFRGTTVAEAVARIGMRGAQMMALSFSLVSQKHRDTCPSFDFDKFWSESLARAVAARCLAKYLRGWDAEEAFVTGMLARIGMLVLATGMADEYEPVLRGAVHSNLPLEERERAVFGADHLETGMQLLREWNLPEIVWRSTGSLASDKERQNRSARVIEVADCIANFMIDDERHTADAVRSLVAAASERLEIDGDAFRLLLGEIGQDWINYGRLLSVQTSKLPDIDAIELQAEEHRYSLRLASELEVQTLRVENEQLGRIARRDRLTGLFNRASFDEELAASVGKAREAKQSMALLMIDADHFKAVNDKHGHRTGDAVLEHLARIFDDHVRKHDQVFRYGGEEFAVIVPNCDEADACELAEKVRQAVEKSPFVGQDANIDLTVSIGIACAHPPEGAQSDKELVEFADQRLYDAKHEGRNKWRVHPRQQSSGKWWKRIGNLLSGAPRP